MGFKMERIRDSFASLLVLFFKRQEFEVFPPPAQCQQGGRVTRETVSRRPQVQAPLAASIRPVEV